MSTMRVTSALLLLALAGCDGPTLSAGAYLVEPDASAVSDARVDDAADEDPTDGEVDEEADAGRTRDGGRNDPGDRRYPYEERRACSINGGQCDGNFFNRICNLSIPMCVECTDNQHCERFGARFRCNEMSGFCRDPDRPPRP